MNDNTKQQYEIELQEAIASFLQVPKSQITAVWSPQSTRITLTMAKDNIYTTFVFEYADKQFLIHSSSCQTLANKNNVIGIIATNAVISLNTILAIYDIMHEILQRDIAINKKIIAGDMENA